MFELAPFPTGKRVAGLPNASTATGSGASIENEERDFSLEEILIPLKSVHRVGRMVMNPKPEPHPGFEPRAYGAGTGIR